MRNRYGEVVDENGNVVSPLDDDYYRYKYMDNDYDGIRHFSDDGPDYDDYDGIRHFQD